MHQWCRVCGEAAAGFHFGAFTCEGCKSFFGRTHNSSSTVSECKSGGRCVITKKNRTACKSCRLRQCIKAGMSKSGSRYGRRSNWFKIHCLLQDRPSTSDKITKKSATGSDDNKTPILSNSVGNTASTTTNSSIMTSDDTLTISKKEIKPEGNNSTDESIIENNVEESEMVPEVTITRKQLPPEIDIGQTNFSMPYNLNNIQLLRQKIEESLLNPSASITENVLPTSQNMANSLLQLQLLAQSSWYPTVGNLLASELQKQAADLLLHNSNQAQNLPLDALSDANLSIVENFRNVFSQVSDQKSKDELLNAIGNYWQYFISMKEAESTNSKSNLSAINQCSNNSEFNIEQNEPIDLSVRRDSEEIIDVVETSPDDNYSTNMPPPLASMASYLKENMTETLMKQNFKVNLSVPLLRTSQQSLRTNYKIPDMIPISDFNHNSLLISGKDVTLSNDIEEYTNRLYNNQTNIDGNSLSLRKHISPDISMHPPEFTNRQTSNSHLDVVSHFGNRVDNNGRNVISDVPSSVLECCVTVSPAVTQTTPVVPMNTLSSSGNVVSPALATVEHS